ncbi:MULTISPECIES: GreA/GreB family elongation factor [Salegentibacter]|mgnify:FL=1|jgi:transcription elongation factor GreB|uniref:Transcription elongation factor GreB n=1 Tax=Salegentibacter agarivorans TaxID=345907 RepID=A0A1I2NCZ8_9FLAO|nr:MULTISPECIES: GreA/GreB family elongation factor [Salegentibacter]APS39718.1 transcription elongation factor GreA [Salegentibacter sp. T436]SFF99366.1 transcription elongation factor GreB [Salegentibacter agarivorans]
MSRGFVKEDDQEEAPIIPPRAALPAGETNYVTPNGLKELKEKEEKLTEERANLDKENETERRRAQAVIDGNLKLLRERISTARVLDPKEQPEDEVRFGALVELKQNGNIQKFQIVGVDEADVKKQKIAFVAPIAKAVTGKKVGDKIDFKLGEEIRKLEILKITY